MFVRRVGPPEIGGIDHPSAGKNVRAPRPDGSRGVVFWGPKWLRRGKEV